MTPMLRLSIHSTHPPGPTCCQTPAHPVEVEVEAAVEVEVEGGMEGEVEGEVEVEVEVDTRNGGKQQKIGLLGENKDNHFHT